MHIIIDRKRVNVADIAEAVARWEAYRDESNEGASVIGNGVTVFDGIEPVAQISYNGRIWPVEVAL